jgi:hypothetical protein
MSKKKTIVFVSLIFVFLVMVLSPWRMKYSKFKKECNGYCESIKNTPNHTLECRLPLGGCYDACIGFKLGEKCSRMSRCFDSCEAICFGLNASPCAPSIFERKINFVSGIIPVQ